MNEDLKTLLNDRLGDIEKRRERQARRTIFVFCGQQIPAELATPPTSANIKVMKEGDALPADQLCVRYTVYDIMKWYEVYTKPVAGNVLVRVWKTLFELLND